MDDPVLLSRIQFAVTVGFHFLFPPISIGLAWLLVIIEGVAWGKRDPGYEQAGRFFAKLLALTFAVGVATGVVMEFQFGMNWAGYSKFVGDIFGAPLAAEAIFAFFLESAFLGLYLFGRERVSKPVHWFAILMVAVGATISAFWILVANSWQQTPAGYVINEQLNRAELVDFQAAVFNPSTLVRFHHTFFAALVCGCFFMIGVSAWLVRRDAGHAVGRRGLKVAVWVGLVSAVFTAFPSGHKHAQQVAHTQPEKFAAIEGLYETQSRAPLLAFGLVQTRPPEVKARVELPIHGLLSWLAFGHPDEEIKGLDAFPPDEVPPLWLTFVSFHNMVILGMLFILLMVLAAVQLARKKLWTSRRLLWVLTWSLPLPLAACQFGWVAAEVGRQPWIVYKLLRTADAATPHLTAGEALFSLALFIVVYAFLLGLYLFVLAREARHALHVGGPEEVAA